MPILESMLILVIVTFLQYPLLLDSISIAAEGGVPPILVIIPFEISISSPKITEIPCLLPLLKLKSLTLIMHPPKRSTARLHLYLLYFEILPSLLPH